MRRPFRYSKGQMAVVYTLALVALLGAAAFGTDVAVMYVNWQHLQKGVDAAALAGAKNLYDADPSEAATIAVNYASLNGIASSELNTPVVAPDRSAITVSAHRTVPYYFGRVLGLNHQVVQVSATAGAPSSPTCVGSLCNSDGTPGPGQGAYGTSTGQYGLIPVGLQYDTTYQADQPVTLTQGGPLKNGTWGPGNWGSLSLGAPGGSVLRSNFANGFDGAVAVGQWVNSATGQKDGPVDQGIQDRINAGQSQDSGGTFSNHAAAG
jgi:Flp pilus assembly protein TadG